MINRSIPKIGGERVSASAGPPFFLLLEEEIVFLMLSLLATYSRKD
jgi:hypothetical protein